MISYTIKYTDLLDNEAEDKVYFHLTKDEVYDLIAERRKTLLGQASRIQEDQDFLEGYQFVRDIVLRSYGERSDDGKRFIKTEGATTAFRQSLLFDEVLEKIFESDKSADAFVNAVMPPKMVELINKEQDKNGVKKPEDRKTSSKK